MERPGVAARIRDQGVRYIIWLDGDTEKVAGGGSLSCAAGPGGGGCFGFAWWQKDADYEASVWDLDGYATAGTVSADVSGTSFLPALVVPIPLIARTQSAACKGLAQQLRALDVEGGQAAVMTTMKTASVLTDCPAPPVRPASARSPTGPPLRRRSQIPFVTMAFGA